MISRSDQNAIEISEMTKIAIDNILPNTRPDRRMPNTPTNDDDSGDSSDNNSSDCDSLTSTLAPPMTEGPPGRPKKKRIRTDSSPQGRPPATT